MATDQRAITQRPKYTTLTLLFDLSSEINIASITGDNVTKLKITERVNWQLQFTLSMLWLLGKHVLQQNPHVFDQLSSYQYSLFVAANCHTNFSFFAFPSSIPVFHIATHQFYLFIFRKDLYFTPVWPLRCYVTYVTVISRLCSTPVTASASRCGGLRSDTTSNLVVPRCRLSTYGTRAFSVAGPVCWNALTYYLKSADLSFDVFKHQLKTFLFCRYWH